MIHRKKLFRAISVSAALLLSLVAVEIGLRARAAVRLARAGSLEQQLERSQRASLGQGDRQGHFTLKGLVQPSSHPELVFEVKAELDGDFKGGLLRTNSWGFRGEEVDLEKPAGTFRIVGLGDSFMFGWGVHQDETYLTLVEQSLNARGGSRTEVLNLAVPGYNTWMEVAAFAAKGIAFDPDLVVMHFYRNDFGLPHFMQDPKNFLSKRKGLYLMGLLRAGLGQEADSEPAELLPWDRVERYPEALGEIKDAFRKMTGEVAYRESMSTLADLTSERSIPVVVIVIDEDDQILSLVREVADEKGFIVLRPGDQFFDYLRENGLDVGQWGETFHVSEKDVHFNKLGHSLIAEALLDLFVKQRLVPPGLGAPD